MYVCICVSVELFSFVISMYVYYTYKHLCIHHTLYLGK